MQTGEMRCHPARKSDQVEFPVHHFPKPMISKAPGHEFRLQSLEARKPGVRVGDEGVGGSGVGDEIEHREDPTRPASAGMKRGWEPVGSLLPDQHLETRTLTELLGKSGRNHPGSEGIADSVPPQAVAYTSTPMKTVLSTRSRRLPTIALGLMGILSISSIAGAQAPDPPDRFGNAARGLAGSTNATPVIKARALAHLAAMSTDPKAVEDGLRACENERARLAFLDALLAGGSRSFDPATAESEAITMLSSMHSDDRAARLDREVRRIESEWPGDPISWGTLSLDDLGWRPFTWSPGIPADRLARIAPEGRTALLGIDGVAGRPRIIAAVLAAAAEESSDEFEAIVEALELDAVIIGPSIVRELARREAVTALFDLAALRPDVIRLPAVRITAAATIARTRPDLAIQMLGGEANIIRLPGPSQAMLRRSLAEGLRDDPDQERWRSEIAQAGQLDDRLDAMLALEGRRDEGDEFPNRERSFEEVKSLRTLGAGRVATAIERGLTDRNDVIRALTDLYLTGRFDLAYSFLDPNTTDPGRPADQWLPVRLALLGEALADSEASTDAWIPLIESLERLDRLDAQLAAIRALRASHGRIHGDRDLSEDVRLTFDNALLEIAID